MTGKQAKQHRHGNTGSIELTFLGRWYLAEKRELEKRKKARSKKWYSQAELDYIYDSMGKIPIEQMADDLCRTVHGLRKKIKQMNLSQTGSVVTLTEVSQIFGVSYRTVRHWVEAGHLNARRTHIRQGPGRVWNVSDKAIENFIHNKTRNIYSWSWQTMPRGYWREYARRIWEGRTPPPAYRAKRVGGSGRRSIRRSGTAELPVQNKHQYVRDGQVRSRDGLRKEVVLLDSEADSREAVAP